MNNIVIFDFNQTLYSPNAQRLLPGVKSTLKTLKDKNYQLFLLCRAAPSREQLIVDLGIADYFTGTFIKPNKSLQDIETIIEQSQANRQKSFVVGDRIKKEIYLGNSCGLQTIWVRRGAFAQELPETPLEQPAYTVSTTRQILTIIP